MKSPNEIKKGLLYCMGSECVGEICPYYHVKACDAEKTCDALAYIQQLEDERNMAVSELVGTCQVCRWEETEKCASCHFCEDAWNVHESHWEWRGVQKEG